MRSLFALLSLLICYHASASVTQAEFENTLAKIEGIYKPILKNKFGANFVVVGKWDDDTQNAFAHKVGKSYFITILGGLARGQFITSDALTAVACHEIGRHIGGYPKENDWASGYGQANYFATLKCTRQLWINDDNLEIVSSLRVDPIIRKHCAKAFGNDNERALCIRSATAGEATARWMATLTKQTVEVLPPEIFQDQSVAGSSQCSLNNFFAGALCAVDYTVDVSQLDPRIGTCNKEDSKMGYRPACWYK